MTKTNHFTIFMALMAVVAATLVAVLATQAPASAQSTGTTFTVNVNGDGADTNLNDTPNVCDVSSATAGEQCSLRAAIQEANNTPGADTIAFNLPANVLKTIILSSALPEITEPLTIDGYTQPGATPNTNVDPTQGTDANLIVELNGANAGTNADGGLRISTSNVVVRGLVINRFRVNGIRIVGSDNTVEGNFIGTDPAGTADLGNSDGVFIRGGSNNTIEGTTPEARNVISGNNLDGVILGPIGQSVTLNKVQGNLIGTNKDGTGALGNARDGVNVENFDGVNSPSQNTLGGREQGAGNVIAFNGANGVVIFGDGAIGNRILGNSIFLNGSSAEQLGIALGLDGGVTPNDPKDLDTGANNLQNFPVLASATRSSDGTTTVTGKLNSRPRKVFTVQFFSSPEGDQSGFGEGKKFLGELNVRTSRRGNASFKFITFKEVAAGEVITATATSFATNDTSEFSKAKVVVQSS